MDGACHVIKLMLKPRFSIYMASYHVASTIHQSLGLGGRERGGGVDSALRPARARASGGAYQRGALGRMSMSSDCLLIV